MQRLVMAALIAGTLGCGGKAPPVEADQRAREALPEPRRGIRLNVQRHAVALDNGLRVISIPELSSELVELGVRYEVGAFGDPPGKAGLAHLAEHLTFHARRESEASIGERLDAIALHHNAHTRWDSTHYTSMAHHTKLPELVAVEADRLSLGCQGITAEIFEREREIVRNELRLRYSGGGETGPRLLAALYPEQHAYGRPIGGDESQLVNTTLADVCAFVERHYVTENAIMVVTGEVDRKLLSRAMREHLYPIERGARPPGTEPPAAPLSAGRTNRKTRADRVSVHVAWSTAPRYSERGILADLVATRLRAEVSRRVADGDLADDVRVRRFGSVRAPRLMVSAALGSRHRPDAITKAIAEAVETVRAPWSKNDVTNAKIATFLRLLRRVEPLAGRSEVFADYAQFDASMRLFTGDLERVDAATPQTLTDLARAMLTDDGAHAVVLTPSDDAPTTYRRADLSYVPAPHERRIETVPAEDASPLADMPQSKVQRAKSFELANGLRVLMFPSFFAQVATVQLIFRSGTADEPADFPGLATFASQLIDAPKSAAVDDDILDSLLVRKSVRVRDDSTVIEVSTLAGAFDHLVKALGRRFVRGRYRAKDIARTVRRLERLRDEPRLRAARRIRGETIRALYGDAAAEHELRPSTNAPTVQDLLKFKLDHFAARNATLVVTGTFTTDVAEAHIRAAFGAMPSGKPRTEHALPPQVRDAPAHLAITEPSQVVTIQLAYPVSQPFDELRGARLVLVEMLRRAISGVREQLAASYVVNTSLAGGRSRGYYSLHAEADRARAGEALTTMRRAVDDLRGGADLEDAFALARTQVVRDLIGGFTSADHLPNRLATVAVHELPQSYFIDLARRVSALSLDQVRDLARRELSAPREVSLLVGPRAEVAKAYSAAGVAAPRFLR